MKNFFTFLPIILLVCSVVFGFTVSAEDALKYQPLVDLNLGMGPSEAEITATDYISNFLTAFMAVIVAMAIFMIVKGGIKLMFSGDTPSMRSEGRNDIMQSIYGLILALMTYTLLNLINPDLIPGADLFSNMKL